MRNILYQSKLFIKKRSVTVTQEVYCSYGPNQHFFDVSNPETPLFKYEKRDLLNRLNTIVIKYKTALAQKGIHFPRDIPFQVRMAALL